MKNIFNIIKKILVWILATITVIIITFTFIAICLFDRQDRELFGYQAFIVLSNSMSKTDFSAGDLILVKRLDDVSTLKEEDIISFVNKDGKIITHKIKKIIKDANGDPSFITYGTTTGDLDIEIVRKYNVLGQYKYKIPKVGKYFNYLKTVPGYVIFILLPFTILIVLQIYNGVKYYKKYKEENSELDDNSIILDDKYEEIMKEISLLKENAKLEEEKNSKLKEELEKNKKEITKLKKELQDKKQDKKQEKIIEEDKKTKKVNKKKTDTTKKTSAKEK